MRTVEGYIAAFRVRTADQPISTGFELARIQEA